MTTSVFRFVGQAQRLGGTSLPLYLMCIGQLAVSVYMYVICPASIRAIKTREQTATVLETRGISLHPHGGHKLHPLARAQRPGCMQNVRGVRANYRGVYRRQEQ